MADLKVIVEPKGDEFSVAVTVPASRHGGQNFGALAKTLLALRGVNPDAFDPQPSNHVTYHYADGSGSVEIPAPPLVERHDGDDEPERSLNFNKAQA